MSHFFHYRNYLLIFVALILPLSENNNLTIKDETKMKYHYGIVKFYNEDNGLGYIKDKNTHDELIVYDEGLIDEINDDDAVKYNIRDTPKGLEAFDVRLRR